MRKAFADTFYYLALFNELDVAHETAAGFTSTFAGQMITTEWVLVELADGLSRHATRAAAVTAIRTVRTDPDVHVVRSDPQLFNEGWELFCRRPDKEWSLTDCISFVVMQQMKLSDALTADRHFEQAGFTAVLK